MELAIRRVSETCPNGVQALKDVTLTIRPGVYGLLGRTATAGARPALDVARMRADSVGHEIETPMDDSVEIGVFGPGTGGTRGESVGAGS